MTSLPTEVRSRRTVGVPMRALARVEHGRRTDFVVGVLTAIAALVLACLALKVWRGDLDVPFTYRQETQYYLMLAKAMEDHGGYFENPSLGAPFGQDLHDFAVGTDRLNLDLLRLLVLFGSPAAAVNVFFLLTFPLAAAAAFLVLRMLGVARAASVICALLFALAPYHFERGEGNLFLSAYWVVPLGAYLVLATLGGGSLFRRREGASGLFAYASGRTLLTVAFCLAVASTGIYYAAFTALLLAGAILIALVARVGRAAVAGGAICLALILAVVLVHLSPSIAYRWKHGVNPAAERHPRESEVFALKLSDLVFPIDLHRLEPLARFTAEYKAATPIRSEPMALGPVAAAGFIGLLLVGLVVLVGRPARAGPPVVRHASAATLLAFLIGTVGGISTVIALLVTPQIRAWNRISIFIAFFAFLAVAVALGALGRRLGTTAAPPAAFAAVLAPCSCSGFGTRSPTTTSRPTSSRPRRARDRIGSSARSSSDFPPGAASSSCRTSRSRRAGKSSICTRTTSCVATSTREDLRWSAGATKGRPEDWVDDLAGIADRDRARCGGRGRVRRALHRPLRLRRSRGRARGRGSRPARLGATGQRGMAGHSFFDLRNHRTRLEATHPPEEVAALRRAVLQPLRLERSGFIPLERSGGTWSAWADEPNAELRIVNESDTPRTAVFEAMLDRVGGPPGDVVVTFPGAAPATYRTPATLRRELALPPGETVVRFSTAAPEVPANRANRFRPHFFRLADLAVTDTAFDAFRPG